MRKYIPFVLMICLSTTFAKDIKRVIVEYTDGTQDVSFPASQGGTNPATDPALASVGGLDVYDLGRNVIIASADASGKASFTVTSRIYLYASINGDASRVDFDINGVKYSEATAPYTYGLQFTPKGWIPAAGTYTVIVTPVREGINQNSKTFFLSVSGTPVSDYAKTIAGFTDLPLAVSAKEYFCGDSGSDETGDGSLTKPFRTMQRATKSVRNATGDRVRPFAGSTFFGSVDWRASGIATCKSGIIAYGDGPRPKIVISDVRGVYFGAGPAGGTVSDVAFIGLELYADKRNPESANFDIADPLNTSHGFDFRTGNYKNILVEDCVARYFAYNIGAQPTNTAKTHADTLVIRRNILTDAWSTYIFGGQGSYIDNTDNLVIEENVFDNNGQLTSTKKTVDGTQYSHAQYLNEGCKNVKVSNNWIMRSANFGVQNRGGGSIVENFFFDNANHSMTCGAIGEVINNVYFGGHGIKSGPNANAGYCGHTVASSKNNVNGNWFAGESEKSKVQGLQYANQPIMLTRREWTPAGTIDLTAPKQNVVVAWPKSPAMSIWGIDKELDKTDNPDVKTIPNIAALWPTPERIAVLRNRPMRNWYTAYTPAMIRAKLNESR